MSSEETTKMDTTAQEELKTAAHQILTSWLAEGIEGVQFLKGSEWKIDEQVFLNSSNDKGYLLLLNQDKDPQAELDYVQVLYASKEDGKWNIYLESLPNLVIPRKKENGSFVANTLSQLAAAGEKEIGRQYKNGNGEINDEFINKEFNEDLKKNHQRFLSRKIKN
ncbi:hypothetical protein [Pedobacter sp. FW305-3-2-15-E-R2A2]|uniref:hypothetical protein n=1 Tax=Pedobacter sp. FW305-3-2-15-E-R2A2 TaxID=3140251 RepID=UPI003140AE15